MAKVPGTFDGSKYEDLRVLLPKPIQDYYKAQGHWDNIVLVKFYVDSDVVWFYKRLSTVNPKLVYFYKNKWGYKDGGGRVIVADDFQSDPPKGARTVALD